MIVNPQLLNYKIVVSTLTIACFALIGFSYYNYSSAQQQQDYLKQEKKLLENQISEIISSHDKLGSTNKLLQTELDATKKVVDETTDSMHALKANLSLIDTYRSELFKLKRQQEVLIKEGDSFSEANIELIRQNESISKILEKQLQVISQLESENENLDVELKNASFITANSFKATAYSSKKEEEIVVEKATKTDHIRVEFVLAENQLAKEETKQLYVQIIGPDNNIVADKGAIKFNESSLIYSSKLNVLYTANNTEVLTDIETNERLEPGQYYVSVYEKNRRLGGTYFTLN
jgi:Tfp pilus assembly protein PilN